MTALTRIADEPWMDQIAVYLVTEVGGHRLIQRPGTSGTSEMIEPGTDPGPSLRLDYDMAQALLHALARHFGQATDSTHTRADYVAERARVDKLIDATIRQGSPTVLNFPPDASSADLERIAEALRGIVRKGYAGD